MLVLPVQCCVACAVLRVIKIKSLLSVILSNVGIACAMLYCLCNVACFLNNSSPLFYNSAQTIQPSTNNTKLAALTEHLLI